MNEDELFGTWLEETRLLQTLSFGTDPHDLDGVERARFITWNMAEAVIELGEAMQEFPGHKEWVTDRSVINREAFIGEIVDALHFIANMLSAVQCTDGELETAYLAKMQKNRDRMASKTYDGVSDKCPICHRELIHDMIKVPSGAEDLDSDDCPTIPGDVHCPVHGSVL